MVVHSIRRAATVAFTLALLAPPTHAQRRASNAREGLDAYTRQAVRDWQIAGLAIAIVKDDSIVFSSGYGLREIGKPDPVTPRTIFAIGSNGKLFTAVAAGLMVDDGKMRWDAPITTYLPWFQLSDPFVTREFTLRDALSHRSGIGGAGGATWYGTPFDRAEILRRIRQAPPASSFRSRFEYQNVMFLAAGEAVGAAAGMSWDDVVRRRIFAPLGMTSSSTSIRDLPPNGDVATPHHWRGGKAVPIPWRLIDNIAGAGSINSNVLDMAQWLRMLLAGGRYGGRQIVRPETMREITSPQMIVPVAPDTLRPSTHFHLYGLGVRMIDYLSVKVLTHGGGIDGMRSQVTWVPERRLGVVVLTNTWGHNQLFEVITYRVLDAYLGASPRDWSRIYLAQVERDEAQAKAAEERAEAARAKDSKPSLPLERYAGTYENALAPDLVITHANGTLSARFGTAFEGPLEHWQYDTFRAHLFMPSFDRENVLATFDLDTRGNVSKVEVPGLGVFTRKR